MEEGRREGVREAKAISVHSHKDGTYKSCGSVFLDPHVHEQTLNERPHALIKHMI